MHNGPAKGHLGEDIYLFSLQFALSVLSSVILHDHLASPLLICFANIHRRTVLEYSI